MFNFFFKKIIPVESDEPECIICLSPLKDKPTIYLENCLHEFHIDCICEWICKKPNCPSCRSDQKNARLLFYQVNKKKKERTILKVLYNLLSRRNNTVSLIV